MPRISFFFFLQFVLFRGLGQSLWLNDYMLQIYHHSSIDKDGEKFEELKFNNGANEIALIMPSGFMGIPHGVVVLRC